MSILSIYGKYELRGLNGVEYKNMENILTALGSLRVSKTIAEHELQNEIAAVFVESGIPFDREYKLGKGSRVDFFADDGIAIEVKKGKPNRNALKSQIDRYAEFEEVNGVVIVVETSLYNPIRQASNNKPCAVVGLQKMWGIAL